jgi:hypothetical protein
MVFNRTIAFKLDLISILDDSREAEFSGFRFLTESHIAWLIQMENSIINSN